MNDVEWVVIGDCGVPTCDNTNVETYPTHDRPEYFQDAERVCESCLRGLTPETWDDDVEYRLGEILWRRHDAEGTTKLVEVTQRLEDLDTGHVEYVLEDPTHTYCWQYHEDDLNDCFWTTGIISDAPKAVLNDRVREVYQRVCEHLFAEVHNEETLEVSGEKCLSCLKRREAQ